MKLEDGKTYHTGTGRRVTIGGTAKDHPEYAWSIQGDWYERSTGKLVHTCRKRGKFVCEQPGIRDIQHELTEEDLM